MPTKALTRHEHAKVPLRPFCKGRKKNGDPCRKRARAGHATCQAHSDQPKGRPTKFTPEVRAKVLEALKAGVWKVTAAQYAGIDRKTLDEWLKRGRAAIEIGETDDPYAHFLHACESAEAGLEVFILGNLVKAAAKDWRAGAFIAERKWPEKYGRRDSTLIEIETDSVPELLGGRQPASIPRARRERILEILREEDDDDVLDAEVVDD